MGSTSPNYEKIFIYPQFCGWVWVIKAKVVSYLREFPHGVVPVKLQNHPIWRVNSRGRGTCLLNNVLLGVSFEYYALLTYMVEWRNWQALKT